MEKVFFVENGDLDEVNRVLAMGGRVKMIHTVAESVYDDGYARGSVYLYVVVEMPKH